MKGSIPCGCSKKPMWKPFQYEVLVKRRCNVKGYNFLGWNGDWLGNKTKITLYNPKTGNSWSTCSIDNFLNNGNGDPEESRLKIKESKIIDDEVHIQQFNETGKFLKGTYFYRSKRKDKRGDKPYWNYICPVCSNDEYVNNGVCSGVFESCTGNLKRGRVSCRCSASYLWSQPQREYQIKKVLAIEKGKFVCWNSKEGYKNCRSKFKWLCIEGHDCETSVINFLNKEDRCPLCSGGNGNGFYPIRVHEKDHLYICSIEGLTYFKVGRSFRPKDRIKENQTRINTFLQNKHHRYQQNYLFIADHFTIYNLEQLLIGFDTGLYDKDRPEDTYGSSELIKNKYYSDVVRFCKDYTEEWWR